jgi:hypothetical protein
MIEIKLLEDKDSALICNSNNVLFKKGIFVYQASENGRELGICIFGIENGDGRLYAVVMNGDEQMPIADGLIRSALSLMYQRGVIEALCSGRIAKTLLLGAGFRQSGENWLIKLKESFFAGCGGDK